MELSQIKFKGFDVNGSSLVIHDDTKGGKYRLKFSDHAVTSNSDEDGNRLFIQVTPTTIGFEVDAPDEENPVFEASVSLTLEFECNFKDEVPEDFYDANSWYFDNFVYLSAKLSIEKILENTVLEDISLPWSQPF